MYIEKLKYPIGNFVKPKIISSAEFENCVNQIEEFPNRISILTKDLSLEELNLVYRPDGWTIKQVIHHCADSHINAFIRTKLALTEILPVIKPYQEAAWANLIDGNTDSISDSLMILTGIHSRWTLILKNIKKVDLEREYYHPENDRSYRLDEVIALYAWHCNHHLAHIEQALKHKGIF